MLKQSTGRGATGVRRCKMRRSMKLKQCSVTLLVVVVVVVERTD